MEIRSFFFFNDTATTEIYTVMNTLSLHDALPILALGSLLGLAAGYYGRWIGIVITRACDIVLSFRVIILYMIILAHFGSSAWNIIGVLTLTKAPIIARIVRGMTLDLREREYVAAAKMRGESALYIMLVEILPMRAGRSSST